MLFILSGQDDFSLTQALEEIKKGIGDPAILAPSTTMLNGQQSTLDQLKTICETVPFLVAKRLVIIEGLLERFEPKSKTSRPKKAAGAANQQDEYKNFASFITRVPESTILVLVEGKIGNNNPLFKEIASKAVSKVFPLLRDAKLHQWVQKQVKEGGGSISTQAVELLAKLVGSNLWIMTSEIEKLILFTSGRRIEEEDVKALVSVQPTSVFTMVDAIIESRVDLAEQLLEQMLQRGAAPAYLLAMLTRQVRMILRARELESQGKPMIEIQHRLGLTSEFALRKTLEQARRYSLQRIKEVYSRLLEADISIKTGRYEGELALDILVVELCQREKVAR